MVILTSVQRPVDVTTKWWGIDVIKKIQAADNIVIFQQSPSSFVFSSLSAEFANDDALGGSFQSKGYHDSLNVLPLRRSRALSFAFWDDEFVVAFPAGLN